MAETTWPAEIKKWEHLYGMTFAVAMGTAGQRKEALLSGADVTIIGRDNVSWMTKNIFFDFDMVVIDELSSFKSPKAQRFKDLKKVRPMAKRVVGLTGTPGNLMDLWDRDLEDTSEDTVTGSSFRISGIVRSFFRISQGKEQKKIYMN